MSCVLLHYSLCIHRFNLSSAQTLSNNNDHSLSLFPCSSFAHLHPANITVNKGANFTLNCSAIGLPDPMIDLLENGRPVQIVVAEEISNGVYLFTWSLQQGNQ